MASEKALDRYLQALSSPDRNIRRKAVVGLVETGSLKCIPVLERIAAEDGDAELCFLARKGLQVLKASVEFRELLAEPAAGAPTGSPSADLAALEARLASPDPAMRCRVVKAAVATRDPRILDVLLRHQGTETDPSARALVLLAVGILGTKEHLGILSTALKDPDPATRRSAVDALGAMNRPHAYPIIVEALNDADTSVRNAAFLLLRRLGKENILKLLRTMLESRQTWMQEAALRACGRFNADEVVDLLEGSLAAEDGAIRDLARGAVRSLAAIGNVHAREVTVRLGEAPPPEAPPPPPSDMDDSTVDMGPVDLNPAAVDLTSADPRKRHKFLQDANLNNDRSVIPDIVRRLPAEPDAKVRASMLITLGRLGGTAELAVITPYLDDAEDRMRASAVEAIATIEGADLVSLLAPRLRDKDNRTRANAIVALKGATGVDLIVPLQELAKSVRIRDRLSAIYAVTHLETPDAVEILTGLTTDPSRVVAKRAEEAQQILTGRRRGAGTSPRRTATQPRRDDAAPSTAEPAPSTSPAADEPTASETPAPPPAEDGDAEAPQARERRPPRRRERPASTAPARPASPAKAPAPVKTAATAPASRPAASRVPRGVVIHAAVDLVTATFFGGAGLVLMIINGGPPTDEAILPFLIIFIMTPTVFLVGGLGLLTGKAWGRHVNACLLHILPVPVLAPSLLAHLTDRESLTFLGLSGPEFPVRAYYAAAAGGILSLFAVLFLMGGL